MIFSLDSEGQIRCYSFKNNEWTPLEMLEGNSQNIYLLYFQNYEVYFYPTKAECPEPLVSEINNPVSSGLRISTSLSFGGLDGADKENIETDEALLAGIRFSRLCL